MITGKNVNITPQAGTKPENTGTWSDWAMRHLAEMRVLRATGILGPENKGWRNVAEHLLVVNATSILLAQKLARAGAPVNVEIIDKASILHDATKRLDKEKGVSYANEHGSSLRQSFLSQFDYPPEVIAATEYTGRVPEMFIEDLEQQKAAIDAVPLNHLVVAYADARVRNTEVVTLEEARDLNKAKVPADTAIYDQWYVFYRNVEDRIMSVINDPDFTPQSISNDSVITIVKEATN